jgi:hypothetical protein
MNPKDIRTSSDPDLAGSYAAMLRAARSAEDVAIKTNTSILVSLDGKDVELTAADLLKLRDKEANQINH